MEAGTSDHNAPSSVSACDNRNYHTLEVGRCEALCSYVTKGQAAVIADLFSRLLVVVSVRRACMSSSGGCSFVDVLDRRGPLQIGADMAAKEFGFARSRWAAVGAAVAVTIGIGGLGVAHAATTGGTPSAFVPVTPCRLFDTRSGAPVGPRARPLAAQETFVQQVTGTNGNCVVPVGASAIALNVTIANPTSASFLTVWPSDVARPLASSLNWSAGDRPTPNKVDVKLSPDGKVSLLNDGGTVDVLADVVGYYSGVAQATTPVVVDAAAFSTDGDPGSAGFRHNFARGRIEGGSNATCGIAPVSFPQNATLTDVTAHVADSTSGPGFDVAVKLWRNPRGVEDAEEMFSKSTSLFPGDITLTGTTITTPLVDNFTYGYFVTVCGLRETNFLYDVAISYNAG